jgi:hypothetical protein
MTAVLGAFFDDSGTHASAPVIVMGGLLGTEEQWDVFAAAWNALLAHPLPGKPPLSRFHLSPCRAGADEFRDYSLVERDRITYLFRHVILDVGLVTVAVAVNKLAWNELVVDEITDQLGDPIGFRHSNRDRSRDPEGGLQRLQPRWDLTPAAGDPPASRHARDGSCEPLLQFGVEVFGFFKEHRWGVQTTIYQSPREQTIARLRLYLGVAGRCDEHGGRRRVDSWIECLVRNTPSS